ncbi:MAG: hypothetical protein AN483_13340 [Aphanizomenon flos-aquae MDT14a]|jgi:hypothetical protein|uniref:Uncharacterized protein n=1 Tax=Aphanizomenon flos-aquae LD13 TaxID=1710894 RepID=A0A1B7VZQ0_APHFL|nr:MAG: hypothetical protein AN481_05650 [Aphanizomenon flos-aquae LD13]OBQ28860.1 MAG: hypothetical protein AN483_13340 [Aphanizomenon flos-aquae MDT14a]
MVLISNTPLVNGISPGASVQSLDSFPLNNFSMPCRNLADILWGLPKLSGNNQTYFLQQFEIKRGTKMVNFKDGKKRK